MAHIGIIGSGIAGLQLGLELQQHGIETTIYSDRTPEQQLERRLSNMVARNGCTRERERQLCVNHWDAASHDMLRLSVCVRGSRRMVFSGCMGAPAQAVDMRIYWAGNHTKSVAFGAPLLVLDMYEHAYALDYGAAAAKYLDAFLANVAWSEVERRHARASAAWRVLQGAV